MPWGKKIISRMIIIIEVLIFIGWYFDGTDGMKMLHVLHAENSQIAQEIVQLQREMANIEHSIAAYQQDSFSREKIAREELQMARRDEEIFFIE